jgi:hypothetical protein
MMRSHSSLYILGCAELYSSIYRVLLVLWLVRVLTLKTNNIQPDDGH